MFFTLGLSQATQAYTPEEGNVLAILGPYIHQNTYHSSRPDVEKSYLGGFALIAQGDTSHNGSLEISMIHTDKIFYRDQGGSFLAEQSQYMHISMGYRYWMSPYFSTALAFYSAYSMGAAQTVTSTIRPGDGLTTSAQDTTEYGFDLSLQGEVWNKGRWAIVLDGRYSYSVTPKENEHANEYAMILGLRYFIQEKQVVEKPKTSL